MNNFRWNKFDWLRSLLEYNSNWICCDTYFTIRPPKFIPEHNFCQPFSYLIICISHSLNVPRKLSISRRYRTWPSFLWGYENDVPRREQLVVEFSFYQCARESHEILTCFLWYFGNRININIWQLWRASSRILFWRFLLICLFILVYKKNKHTMHFLVEKFIAT